MASTPRYPVDVGDDSRFDDVINNVKNLIGGIDRTTTDSIVVSVSETSTPSIISFKTSTKASVPTLDVMKNVDDDDSKPSTNNFIAMMLDILDDASGNAYPLLITGLLLIYFYAFVTTGLSLLSLGGVSLVLLGTWWCSSVIVSLTLIKN